MMSKAIAALNPTSCRAPDSQGAATYEIFYEAGAAAAASHEEMARVSRLQVVGRERDYFYAWLCALLGEG